MLNGHLDHFPVDENDRGSWHRDPYSGDIDPEDEDQVDDGLRKIHGRGVVDMKAGTAAAVIVFVALYELREQLKGSVALCVVSDEETGGKFGTKWLLEQNRRRWGGDCMISGEPGGLGTIRFAEKGSLRATVSVRATGGHGAYLHLGEGAIRGAVDVIRDLVETVEGLKSELPEGLGEYMTKAEVREAIDVAMGKGAADLVLRPTVNVGVIRGGVKVNVIPELCVFEVDIRYPIGLTRGEVMTAINGVLERHPGATIEVQEAASNPPNYCAFDHPMVELLATNAAAVRKQRERPIPVPSIGATDCKHYRYNGIPAYVLGPSPATMGQVGECMEVDEFLTTVLAQAGAAWDYLGGEA